MKLRDIVQKLRDTTSPLARDQNIPDDQTTDKALRSLRRQRRVQLEEFEKEQLRQEISLHQRMRAREAIVGDGKTALSKNNMPSNFKKKRMQSYYERGKIL